MKKQHGIAAASAILAALAFPSSAVLSLAVLVLGIAALVLYPAHERKKKAQALDAAIAREAPWIASELELFPLERVLELHARGALKEHFENVLALSRKGIPLRIALSRIDCDSEHARKFFELLRYASTHDAPSHALRELAREIANANEAKAQAYASKLSFYGVALITLSAILPALCAAYFLLGASFLNAYYSQEFILAAFLLAFPLANVALLAYVHELAPVVS